MTPRPSISPLSAKASPTPGQDLANQHLERIADSPNFRDDDSRSSSLSEPDDDDNEDLVLRDAAPTGVGRTLQRSRRESTDVDSEAETERLERTPDKLHIPVESLGKTPSKLSHVAAVDGGSPVTQAPAGSSSTSLAIASADPDMNKFEPATLDQVASGKKRKRSDTGESSLSSVGYDLASSPREQSHSSIEDDAAIVVGSRSDKPGASAGESSTDLDAAAEGPSSERLDTAAIPVTKQGTSRRVSKSKVKAGKDRPHSAGDKGLSAVQRRPQDADEEDSAVPSADDKLKDSASVIFEDLAKQFTCFREKIFKDKLAALNAELELLRQPKCTHKEYLRQIACVDARYHKQVLETRAFHRFKVESLRRTTLGERSLLHSQYFQSARGLREDVMHQLGEDWYKIQKERRQSHQDSDDAYLYKFPAKRSLQIKQQAKYNKEVSILSGVAKYVGFPAAPELRGPEDVVMEDDLKAMRLSKRNFQAQTHSQPVYIPARSSLLQGQSERLAHEQFIEQNPWARPQGQIQNHGTPNLTHTPNWTEPGPRGPSSSTRNYATPLPHGRSPPADSSAAFSGNASDRGDTVGYGSSLTIIKARDHPGDIHTARNISQTSGVSTVDGPIDIQEAQGSLSMRNAEGPEVH